MPKGKLLIIGGAEDKGDDELDDIASIENEFQRFEILSELLKPSPTQIEIITTGTSRKAEVQQLYQRCFEKLGSLPPAFIHIENRIEANHPDFLKRIEKASAVFFTGGNQFRLSTILGGTPIIDLIKERYLADTHFLVAGTSAGAMAMATLMIAEAGVHEALIDTDVKTTSGLGFLQNCIIDTHFIKRGRFGRLAHAIIINPGQLGIGLGEDTALLISNGDLAECCGSGMVVIIDGKDIKQTNVTYAGKNDPVFVENLVVHLLVRGCKFSIKQRQLVDTRKGEET